MNKKRKKTNKIVVFVAISLILVFLIVAFCLGFKVAFGSVKPYITEQVDIYIPDGMADEFRQNLSIDIDEYWIFHLNEKEQIAMYEDIEINSWRIMNDADVMIVEEYTGFDNDSDIYKSINNHKCYIYIFDCDNEIELPNENGYFRGNDCYHWLFFIYDVESNYYYVVHQSM